MDVLDEILQAPFMPTVYPMHPGALCALAQALHDEGYPALEMLCRPIDKALPVLKEAMAGPHRDVVRWGIGTLRTREAAEQAVSLKPDFVVSPAFSRDVLDVAAGAGIAYIPAVLTFQDVQNVLDAFSKHGLAVKVLKLCPVYDVTQKYVESLRGCFPGITYCPTGEMTMKNYTQWKQMPGIAAPMGSAFLPRQWLESQDVDAIRKRLKLIKTLADEVPG